MRNCILVTLFLFLIACGRDATHGKPPAPERLRIDGSTTLYEAVHQLGAGFMAAHPGVEIEVTHSSSGTGIRRLIAGELDIASAARAPLADEVAAASKQRIALKTYQVAYDALAIAVPPAIGEHIHGLTFDQLRAIFFDGTITQWSQLDPKLSGPINVYARDQKVSGASAVFTEHLTGREDTPYVSRAVYLDSTLKLLPAVAADAQGIAAVPVSFLDQRVRGLAAGPDPERLVVPSTQAVRDLSYPLRRDLYMVTRGTPAGTTSALIRFALSNEGQAIFAAAGLTSLR